MKRTFIGLFGAGLASLLCSAALFAAEPVPVLDFDFSKISSGQVKDGAGSSLVLTLGKDASAEEGALKLKNDDKSYAIADAAAFKKWSKKFNARELASAFWIRFDKGMFSGTKNAQKASLGLFDCYLDKDNRICVKLFVKKTEFLAPVVMTSSLKAEPNKWYHVEFSYSQNSKKFQLYIDGKFQMENATLILPEVALGEFKMGDGFNGAIKDFKLYDAALDSEELALCVATDADFQKLGKDIADAQKIAKNAGLKSWLNKLDSTLKNARKNQAKLTIAAYKRIAKDISNACEITAQLKDNSEAMESDIVANYVTPATTQALYLPTTLPENGKLTKNMDVIMAQDEFETSSLIVVPYAPVKKFELKMSDLKSGNDVIPASDVDLKLVKRWYRTGGAWLAYHVDLYMRVLVPDMLLNDDNLIKVDDFHRSNEILMHYPNGDRYVNISNFEYNRQWLTENGLIRYFYDAPTLQPLTLPEAGRNQQFIVTFRTKKATKAGTYTGKLQMVADGKAAGAVNVTVKVLPFVLPQPRAYYDTSKVYISHINNWDGVPQTLKNAMDHNLMHMSNIATNGDYVKECVKIGYPLEIIFGSPLGGSRDNFVFGGPDDKITPEYDKQMVDMFLAPYFRAQALIEKYSPARNYMVYHCWTSEASWYGAISVTPDRVSRLLNERTKFKLFSHGMSDALPYFSNGIYDMNSSSAIKKVHADIWHAAGGRAISYAAPFPGPENPGLMRRALGLESYKANLYDGHMMHGYIGNQLNEFTKYPGGDGDYRTFCLAYGQKDGCINRIAIVGVREAYDDVRYATAMKIQAEQALKNSKDELVIREAKRQLSWLERIDGDKKDLDDFRTEVQYCIVTLQNLIKVREGK